MTSLSSVQLGFCTQLAAPWSNADITLLCEAPKVGPHRDAIRARLAEVLGITPARVIIKATTMEKLGTIGRAEGLAAEAVVLVKL